MRQVMLTTKDNPFNPFDDFDSWYQYDMDHGYDTCGHLARLTFTSDSLSDEENLREMERAIKSIIVLDPFDLYRRVVYDTADNENE